MVDLSKIKVPKVEPFDTSQLPMKLPKIEIDYSKCTVPMWCKRCLQSCPHMVFTIYAKKMEKYKENDSREPGMYEVLQVRRDKCTMCGKCVENCPEGALTISYGDTVLKGTKQFDTVEAAKKTDYYTFQTPRPYSYELSEEMLDLLREEFDPAKIVAKFAQTVAGKQTDEVDGIAKEVFSEYGRNWMKKVLQLGGEYTDRTYEILKEAVDRTGELFFPLVPQRFIEIAYLSTQQFLHLTIVENYSHRLVFKVPNCDTFKLLQEQCGSEIAELMPCKHACLSGLEALCRDLDLDVTIDVDAEAAKDGYCQFRLTST